MARRIPLPTLLPALAAAAAIAHTAAPPPLDVVSATVMQQRPRRLLRQNRLFSNTPGEAPGTFAGAHAEAPASSHAGGDIIYLIIMRYFPAIVAPILLLYCVYCAITEALGRARAALRVHPVEEAHP